MLCFTMVSTFVVFIVVKWYRQTLTIFSRDPFYSYELASTPSWMSNYIHYDVWDEISYPFRNFNDSTRMDK